MDDNEQMEDLENPEEPVSDDYDPDAHENELGPEGYAEVREIDAANPGDPPEGATSPTGEEEVK